MNFHRPAKVFLILTLSLWIALLLFLVTYEKSESFRLLQITHNQPLNIFMQVITHVGDGITVILLSLLAVFFVSYRNAILLVGGFLLSGMVVQGLKNTVFKEEARPVKWFRMNNIPLDVPEGLSPHEQKSFPSGHSATTASLMLFMAMRSRKAIMGFFCFAGMALICYTRIYLYHHFPADVLAGIFIGIAAQLFVELFLVNRLHQLNKRIIQA
jgi:undecaprenyl-diphosphatase